MQNDNHGGLSRERYLLASWQAGRLAKTYADLHATARYGAATTFFLTDLYGPRDFSKRDRDGERVASSMKRLLPGAAIRAIGMALELNHLTHRLDAALEAMLFQGMGVTEITEQNYAQAYRRCDNHAERLQQIEIVDTLGRQLDKVVSKPLVQIALKLAHGPAHMAGLGELQDFLERGVAAFLQMQGADYFLETIKSRETSILTRIYAGEDAPFDVALPESAARTASGE